MTVAIVDNNIVTAIMTITNDQYQSLANQHQIVIDITSNVPQPAVGWIFDGANLISNGITNLKITKLAFLERFQPAELGAFYTAVSTNPMMAALKDELLAATYIDLSRPDTIQALNVLESVGILSSSRLNTILTTPPTSIEIYQG